VNNQPDKTVDSRPVVTRGDIVDGLGALGLAGVEIVVVHSSLRAFGWVAGGAETVVAAVRSVVPTVIAPAFTYEARLPSPPDSDIPFNADTPAATWQEFHEVVRRTPVHRTDGPIDGNMGAIAAALAAEPDAARSPAPICGFSGVGPRARELLSHGTASNRSPSSRLLRSRARGYCCSASGIGRTRRFTSRKTSSIAAASRASRASPTIRAAGRRCATSAVRRQASRLSSRTCGASSGKRESVLRRA